MVRDSHRPPGVVDLTRFTQNSVAQNSVTQNSVTMSPRTVLLRAVSLGTASQCHLEQCHEREGHKAQCIMQKICIRLSRPRAFAFDPLNSTDPPNPTFQIDNPLKTHHFVPPLRPFFLFFLGRLSLGRLSLGRLSNDFWISFRRSSLPQSIMFRTYFRNFR